MLVEVSLGGFQDKDNSNPDKAVKQESPVTAKGTTVRVSMRKMLKSAENL